MDDLRHNMTNLFAQLGLPTEPGAIQAFIATHRPIERHTALYEAPFWNASQAAFLRESIDEDADWAVIIDKLDTELRQTS